MRRKRRRKRRRCHEGGRCNLRRASSEGCRWSRWHPSERGICSQRYYRAGAARTVRGTPRGACGIRDANRRKRGWTGGSNRNRAGAVRDCDPGAGGQRRLSKRVAGGVTDKQLTVRVGRLASATLRHADWRRESREGRDVRVSARCSCANGSACHSSVHGGKDPDPQRCAAKIDECSPGSGGAGATLSDGNWRRQVVRVCLDDVRAVAIQDRSAVLDDSNARTGRGLHGQAVGPGRGIPHPVLLNRVRHDDLHVRGQDAAELVGDTVQVRASQRVRTRLTGQADRHVIEREGGALAVANRVEAGAVCQYPGAVTRVEHQRCLAVDEFATSRGNRQAA